MRAARAAGRSGRNSDGCSRCWRRRASARPGRWLSAGLAGEEPPATHRLAEVQDIPCSSGRGLRDLVGDVEALPQLESGEEMDIGEDWMVEVFGREVMLGRRTVHFRPVAVRRGELVEPGRQVVEIEPGPFVPDEELWWTLARPEPAVPDARARFDRPPGPPMLAR